MKTLYRFRPFVHAVEWNDSRKKTLLFILYILLSLVGFASDAAIGSATAKVAGQPEKTFINDANAPVFIAEALIADKDNTLFSPAPVRNNTTGNRMGSANAQSNINNVAAAFLDIKPRNDK